MKDQLNKSFNEGSESFRDEIGLISANGKIVISHMENQKPNIFAFQHCPFE